MKNPKTCPLCGGPDHGDRPILPDVCPGVETRNAFVAQIKKLQSESEPNMDAIKTREINILVAENRSLLALLSKAQNVLSEHGQITDESRVGWLMAEIDKALGIHGLPAEQIHPHPLNMAHETAIETFAKDGRLWTTEETVRFNLRTFARVVLRASLV